LIIIINDPIHWTDNRFGVPFVLFILYGFSDSIYQTYLYWLMRAMSNYLALLAHYASFYKAIQSVGAAAAFGIDASPIHLAGNALFVGSLYLFHSHLYFLVANKVTEANVSEELFISGDLSRGNS
jgi:hypothetical protein